MSGHAVVRIRCNTGGRMEPSVRGMDVEKRIISREMVDRRKAIRPGGTKSPSSRPVPHSLL